MFHLRMYENSEKTFSNVSNTVQIFPEFKEFNNIIFCGHMPGL